MGMLDDAIREHLDLKRRRGADPGEVAREQREALASPLQALAQDQDAEDLLVAPTEDGAGSAAASTGDKDDDILAGETAELDMSTVLAIEADEIVATPPEESLEWETPPHGELSREAQPSRQQGVE